MRITRRQLTQIIREEAKRSLHESNLESDSEWSILMFQLERFATKRRLYGEQILAPIKAYLFRVGLMDG